MARPARLVRVMRVVRELRRGSRSNRLKTHVWWGVLLRRVLLRRVLVWIVVCNWLLVRAIALLRYTGWRPVIRRIMILAANRASICRVPLGRRLLRWVCLVGLGVVVVGHFEYLMYEFWQE